jgi:hypothetical protein
MGFGSKPTQDTPMSSLQMVLLGGGDDKLWLGSQAGHSAGMELYSVVAMDLRLGYLMVAGDTSRLPYRG